MSDLEIKLFTYMKGIAEMDADPLYKMAALINLLSFGMYAEIIDRKTYDEFSAIFQKGG